MSHKEMLTTKQLIKHMQEKNITFNYVSIPEAQHVLDTVNYYFKLASYRKNFPEDENGKYINLDFAYLIDLSSIDDQLREYLLQLTLSVEHGIKTLIISMISNDEEEDGYSIVKEFKQIYSAQYQNTLAQFNKNKYLQDMYSKYYADMPVWVFMEIMSFGVLSQFVDFYCDKKGFKSLKQIRSHLKFCKNIRNACAHSNPMLVNLFSDKEFIKNPSGPVISAGMTMKISRQYISDLKINDLISVFYLYKKVCSKKYEEDNDLNWDPIKSGERLISRFKIHENWYSGNTKLNAFIAILNKLIDYLDD